MNIAVMLAVILGFAAALPHQWLDAKVPANWNTSATIPTAPGPRSSDLEPGGRCASEVRPPTSPEDRAVVAKGWFLFGPYQRFGATSTLMAASSADGMCRVDGYQGFVFVDGAFAGTLAPHPMDSRTDASMSAFSPSIYNAHELNAAFVRYTQDDPLCCPRSTTNVSYKIETANGRAVLVPISADTSPNSP